MILTLPDSELFFKVSQGEEIADRIKAFLFLPVASLHLAIMPGCVRTNELVLDTKIKSSFLKKGLDVPFTVGKTVGKFKIVVSPDTFYSDASAGIPLPQSLQEAGGGAGGLLRISRQEAEPGELVNGSILKQAQLRVRDAAAGNNLHFHPVLQDKSSVGKVLGCKPSSPAGTSL